MKRVEITFPEENKQEVEDILEKYKDIPVFLEAEREGRDFLRCETILKSETVDELIREVKDIRDIDSGDLIIEVLEQTAHVEKGQKQKGGTSKLSHYEMYKRAFNFSTFDNSAWAMIILASVIAVIGLSIENVIVVIGAMVIAPMLGPFIASSFGLVVGDTEIIEEGIFHAAGSILLAVITAFVIGLMFDIQITPLITLVTEPGFGTVPLSLSVGSAAALAFSSEARETLAGVAVAIALVPPSAAAGLMLANFNLGIFFDVSLIILSNTMSLILAGSITFKLLGAEADTWYRKKVSEQKLKKAIAITSASILLITGLVGYTSYKDLQKTSTKSEIEKTLENKFGDKLMEKEVVMADGDVNVTATIVDAKVNEEQLKSRLENYSDGSVKLDITELATVKR